MILDAELAAFIEGEVMMIVGTCDATRAPRIARAVGALVDTAIPMIDLMVSRWQWPDTIANVSNTGAVAATFARPSDYVSYQIKGQGSVIAPSPVHRVRARQYIQMMSTNMSANGIGREITAPWLGRQNLSVIRLIPQQLFIQTPGERAGQLRDQPPCL